MLDGIHEARETALHEDDSMLNTAAHGLESAPVSGNQAMQAAGTAEVAVRMTVNTKKPKLL